MEWVEKVAVMPQSLKGFCGGANESMLLGKKKTIVEVKNVVMEKKR